LKRYTLAVIVWAFPGDTRRFTSSARAVRHTGLDVTVYHLIGKILSRIVPYRPVSEAEYVHGWTAAGRTGAPRVHDLRHRMVVRRIGLW